MMSPPGITHLFFRLHGVLTDPARMYPAYSLRCGEYLAARFGLTADRWAAAHRQTLADWDSYYADLDLEGDDGMDHFWEGLFRTTRALFRIAGAPEPDYAAMIDLGRALAGFGAQGCDTLYPGVNAVVIELAASGLTLGVASHALSALAEGLLIGAGVRECFAGPILGPDSVGTFRLDACFQHRAAQMAGVDRSQCAFIAHRDDLARLIERLPLRE
jgi:phosphoglycolate phosphatase-like HAD superfamily hydrolase